MFNNRVYSRMLHLKLNTGKCINEWRFLIDTPVTI